MELVNHTPFPAALFRTVIDQERLAASVFARVTYDIREETLVPTGEQVWQVSGPPWEGPQGPMESDEIFYKGGVDLFVFGHARAPGGRPVTEIEVRIEVGTFQKRVIVVGDRVWEARGKRLVPSAPKPFSAIPLTPEFAYGGTDKWDELDVSHPDNPRGKGYYLEKENAIGGALPNLEDQEKRITAWEDKPNPVGLTFCPMTSGQRMRNGIELDEKGSLKAIRPVLFNSAFPDMILERVVPGDRVRLSGLDESGPLAFSIPATDLIVRLQFDAELIERPLAIDQVGIEVDARRAFIGYRYPFRYVMYPLQKRSCELLLRASGEERTGAAKP
jgi:hypothetical protein